jgi:hypothetical protein
MLAEIKVDLTGVITCAQFVQLMTEEMEEREPDDEIHQVFMSPPGDESGRISFKTLKCINDEIGGGLSARELPELIEDMEHHRTGHLMRDFVPAVWDALTSSRLFVKSSILNHLNFEASPSEEAHRSAIGTRLQIFRASQFFTAYLECP